MKPSLASCLLVILLLINTSTQDLRKVKKKKKDETWDSVVMFLSCCKRILGKKFVLSLIKNKVCMLLEGLLSWLAISRGNWVSTNCKICLCFGILVILTFRHEFFSFDGPHSHSWYFMSIYQLLDLKIWKCVRDNKHLLFIFSCLPRPLYFKINLDCTEEFKENFPPEKS